MTNFRRFATIAILCSTPMAAESHQGAFKWLRRATLATACVFAATDIASTYQGAGLGLRERGVFRDAEGHPRMRPLIISHVGLCGGMFVVQEFIHMGKTKEDFRAIDVSWSAANLALAAGFGKATIGNYNLIKKAQGQ